MALCAQPFDWLTLVEVAKTLLLPRPDVQKPGEGIQRGGPNNQRRARPEELDTAPSYCTVLDQADVLPDSKPSAKISSGLTISTPSGMGCAMTAVRLESQTAISEGVEVIGVVSRTTESAPPARMRTSSEADVAT